MLVSFDTIQEDARIWIFPSSRLLTNQDVEKINHSCSSFLTSWTAHKMDLNAALKVVDHAFLVISVDEQMTGASGCSLDKLHQFVKELGANLSVSFLERLNVTFLSEDEKVNILPIKEVESLLQNATISPSTIVYDVTLLVKGDLDTKFKVPLRETWINRYAIQ